MQSFPLLASCLSGLTPDLLACVLDALALVRLGWTKAANLSGNLSNDFLVRAFDKYLRRQRSLERDPLRRLVLDRMRVSKSELQSVRTRLRLVSDADDVELLREALRHAFHHVGDERARETMKRLVLRIITRAIDRDDSISLRDLHIGRDRARELALRPLDRNAVAVERDRYAGRYRDRILSNSRHSTLPVMFSASLSSLFLAVTRRARESRRRCASGAPGGPTSDPATC